MTKLFSINDSLDVIYTKLLQAQRVSTRQEELGTAICRNCGSVLNAHLHDGRCSTSALSRVFTNVNVDSLAAIKRGLELIEELQIICGQLTAMTPSAHSH